MGIVHQTFAEMSRGAAENRPSPPQKFLAEAGRVPDPGGAHPGRAGARGARVLRCRAGQQLARRQSVPSLAAASPGWRPREETTLESPDHALELGHPLAQGRVLSLEAGECGGRRLGTHLPPPGDAAPGGADVLGVAARQRRTADDTQPGRVRRTYVTRREVWREGRGRVASMAR